MLPRLFVGCRCGAPAINLGRRLFLTLITELRKMCVLHSVACEEIRMIYIAFFRLVENCDKFQNENFFLNFWRFLWTFLFVNGNLTIFFKKIFQSIFMIFMRSCTTFYDLPWHNFDWVFMRRLRCQFIFTELLQSLICLFVFRTLCPLLSRGIPYMISDMLMPQRWKVSNCGIRFLKNVHR